ncbi:hypothetical protein L3Q82_000900 [Scortum barcoo]|uniref:Uncharacterized protein n=1 Tax=Scortum barcoo TaxID=214431 RepID=A0ACB8WAG2_9TELE|nr:hypothetical protein L3Q82_000900 [Scortum barcoo]
MAARSSAAGFSCSRGQAPISTFLVGPEANFTGFACVNKRVRYSRTELIKIRDGSATSTTPQTADLGLRALLGRLQLLRTPDWREALPRRRTEGKRKRCARKQKRGKRGGLLARLKANAGRPPIPSLFLSNVRSLDNKLDLLRLRLGVSREMRNCAVLCLTETWLKTTCRTQPSSSTADFCSVRTEPASSRGKAGRRIMRLT